MALSSKSDREILAQSILSNEERRAAKESQLFGIGSSGTGGVSRHPLLSNHPQPNARPSMGKRVKSNMKRSSPKGKAPVRSTEQDLHEDNELEWEEMPERNWDEPTSNRFTSAPRTMLDWASFDWKPDPKSFLRGISNYSIYRETILLQLECIGYHSDVNLTPLDELKLAAVIQRTVTEEVAEMIVGMKSGSAIIKLFESTYRRTGLIQVEALWERLSGLRYTGGCPVDFVTKFKTEARNYQAAGGQSSSTHLMILFKQAVKERAGKWHNMVSSLSRFHEWKLEQLLQDFISSHFERIGRGGGLRNSQVDIKGVLGNTQIEKGKSPKKKQHKNDNADKGRRKGVRCWFCKKEGHVRNECPDNKKNNENRPTKAAYNNFSTDIGPPPALADEYCKIPEQQVAGSSYSTHVEPSTYDNIVDFYETEMSRRRGEVVKREVDRSKSYSPTASIQVAQQILSTASSGGTSNFWLFDTGADIDATNNRQNFTPGTVVELKPGQFPIQTGNGTVDAESIGEVWLPLTGPGGTKSVMRLKYVAYLRKFPLNIVSGERFYRRGGRLNHDQLISPNEELLSYINAERRGFFLWLYNQPEPVKSIIIKKNVSVASTKLVTERYEDSDEIQIFRKEYQACVVNGCFVMSDKILQRLVLWHRRLCHPSAERLKWTIKNTVGIDLNTSDVEQLPCIACDMGKSLKYTTKQRQPRMNNVGEGWHCDIGTLNPPSIEGHNYFCLTTEDVSRFRIFRALKKKSEAADELKHILTKANLDLRRLFNLRVKQITIDGGRDWGLSTFQEFASQQEIDVVISAPDNQYQNGVSERGIRFVQDAARCCTIQLKVPSVFWNYMLEMTCYTLNRTSQSSVQKNKTPWEVYWLQFDPEKSKTNIDHLWIPGTLCITHVDASHRVTGEKLDANGTRSIFFGYRGSKNKLVWLLDGGRFLVSPHVVAYENTSSELGWGVDLREIVRSLPKHVQDRLKARKTDYARNQDYNNPDGLKPVVTTPRRRGRPKRVVQRPYGNQMMQTLEAPFTVDNEFIHVLEGVRDDIITDKGTVIENFQDAATGRCFGSLVIEPNVKFDYVSFNATQKAINRDQFGNQTDGDELFRAFVNCSDISSHILAHLWTMPEYERNHRHISEFGSYGLHCAVDSSFADDFDTAKSTTGYVVFMAGCPVIWRSKLQTTVSTLTCEAEYAALFEATKECAWIRSFLTELGHMPAGPIPILEDNTGAIKWATDDAMTSGRRHVRIEYHYIVQEVRSKNIILRKVASEDNAADGFTKPLAAESFKQFIEKLGLKNGTSL